MTRLGVTLLVTLAAGSLVSPAAAAVSTLLGHATIEGPGGMYEDVKVRSSLRAFPDKGKGGVVSVDLKGDGDILGVELRRVDVEPDPLTGSVPLLRSLRIGPADRNVQLTMSTLPNGIVEPGHYRLYLISEKPGFARLAFPDAKGKTTLQAANPFPFSGGQLGQETLQNGTVVFGGRGTLPTRGLMLMHVLPYEDAEQMVADDLELCLYLDGPRSDAGAYGPGCPGGATVTSGTA